MNKLDAFRRRVGGEVCRRCINQELGLNLTPGDCIYPYPYPQRCACCGQLRNIVMELRTSGKLKLFFKR